MSYYEQLLAKHGITLSEEARIARTHITRAKESQRGKPRSQDLKTVKRCPKCSLVLPIEQFHIARDRYDGRDSRCKGCKNAIAQIERDRKNRTRVS